MNTIERKRVELNINKKPNKVLEILNKKKQSNPGVTYIINQHSKDNMKKRFISESEVVKSIEEFDKFYINDDRTIVEKKFGDHVVRTIYSYNMYTKEIFIITTMHISKKKFNTVREDIL